MTIADCQSKAICILSDLRTRYPGSPFLALGQTVMWDEPMKAVVRRLLDQGELGGTMLLGVHDTDYFAKTHIRQEEQGRFALMPHNDGTTKALWSAAGEISTLFGSETFPTRHELVRSGVAFEKVARQQPGGRQPFLDAMTEAWGWRGLVYTGKSDLIVNRLPLKDVGDGVLEMLTWGFENAIVQVAQGCCQNEARQVGLTILGWCQEYRKNHPQETLSSLYQSLLPRLYALLLGEEPRDVQVDCTTNLLRLNPDTAGLPRFKFVDLFLKPETRDLATYAYNQAVTGSTIYTLDRFGAGALPFDLVLPERGRGTLRITPRVLFAETRQPVAIGLKKPIESLEELADVLCHKFGDQVTLVGKAVSLVSMMAQEFIFVFNEEGSMYVRRTRQMNDILLRHKIPLDMRPILRVRYQTWDSLHVGHSSLRLPAHLASAFGEEVISDASFAQRWRGVVEDQKQLCETSRKLKQPVELMRFLAQRKVAGDWNSRISEYQNAKRELVSIREETAPIQAEVNQLYAELKRLKKTSQELQLSRGAHFRQTMLWIPAEQQRREAYQRDFEEIEHAKRSLHHRLLNLRERRQALERGERAQLARAAIDRIVTEAEAARLRLVCSAVLTIEGLPHTNHRPSSWWIPMVDHTGAWFQEIVRTTELYCEPLVS